MTMASIGTWWMWTSFLAFIGTVIVIDLCVFSGKQYHRISIREAFSWALVWAFCAFVFAGLLWWYVADNYGRVVAHQKALEFITGYLIEQSLSIDNMFVFIMIFNHFAVPEQYQRRVLLYGVLSAIIMRFIMIAGGTWLVYKVHWVLYIFGAFLLFT